MNLKQPPKTILSMSTQRTIPCSQAISSATTTFLVSRFTCYILDLDWQGSTNYGGCMCRETCFHVSWAENWPDGTIIRGQNEISHPPTNGSVELVNKSNSSARTLPSRIKRVFYMSSEGSNLLHEVFPSANPTVLEQLNSVDCIIYAMGSLFTSICPSLVLRGIGESISSRSCPKVLLLNGTHDRETSGFTASCFVTAITDALNRTHGDPHKSLKDSPSQYINTIFVPKHSQIPIDTDNLAAQGVFRVVTVQSVHDATAGIIYDPKSLIQSLSNLLTGCTIKNVAAT